MTEYSRALSLRRGKARIVIRVQWVWTLNAAAIQVLGLNVILACLKASDSVELGSTNSSFSGAVWTARWKEWNEGVKRTLCAGKQVWYDQSTRAHRNCQLNDELVFRAYERIEAVSWMRAYASAHSYAHTGIMHTNYALVGHSEYWS